MLVVSQDTKTKQLSFIGHNIDRELQSDEIAISSAADLNSPSITKDALLALYNLQSKAAKPRRGFDNKKIASEKLFELLMEDSNDIQVATEKTEISAVTSDVTAEVEKQAESLFTDSVSEATDDDVDNEGELAEAEPRNPGLHVAQPSGLTPPTSEELSKKNHNPKSKAPAVEAERENTSPAPATALANSIKASSKPRKVNSKTKYILLVMLFVNNPNTEFDRAAIIAATGYTEMSFIVRISPIRKCVEDGKNDALYLNIVKTKATQTWSYRPDDASDEMKKGFEEFGKARVKDMQQKHEAYLAEQKEAA